MAQIVQRINSSDPVIDFMTDASTVNTVIGLDTSESNKFKINVGTAIVDESTFTLTAANAAFATGIDATGAVYFDSSLNVTGNTLLKGTLGVTGAATMDGALNVTGIVTAADAVNVGGALDVTGASTVAALDASGAVVFDNTLGVSGITTISNTTNATSVSTGCLVLSGGLGIAENMDIFCGGEITSASDATMKENITPISNPFEKLNKINGVSFDWINTGKPSYGVIAQEVETVMPAAVTLAENGKRSVNYNCIVGLLVEAVKELYKK